MIYWTAVRQSVLATVFLSYLLNFTLQYIARKSKHERTCERIRETHFKVFIFGLSSLFSCNLLQGGWIQLILCWIIFFLLCFVHYANFKEIESKKRQFLHLIFYFSIVCINVLNVIHYILPSF